MLKPRFNICLCLIAGLGSALLLESLRPAWGVAFERTLVFDADELRLANLVGSVRVVGHGGNEIRVRVRVEGGDASESLIRLEERKGRRAELVIHFPVQEHRRYVYPPLGARSRSRFQFRSYDSDWLGQMLDLGGKEIEVRGEPFRDAVEIWADVEVQLPRDKHVALFLGLGAMETRDVQGDVLLDTHGGNIVVERLQGQLRADTGSGSVRVADVKGEVDVDTGSGSVDVSAVEAAQRVRVDTGSGSVVVRSVSARELAVDTGSGGVDLEAVRVEELSVDTGSGGVEAIGIEADGVAIDTGSGSVRLELERMGAGRYEVDTGSGTIRLSLPKNVSAVFAVDTGSGGIVVDLDGVDLGRKRRQEARFTVGSGESRVMLSTGSGSVRITQGAQG